MKTHFKYDNVSMLHQAQGHQVNRSVRLSVGLSPSNIFHYNSWSISRIETKIGVRVNIDDGKNFLEGQGHWVKGQGQFGDFGENVFGL